MFNVNHVKTHLNVSKRHSSCYCREEYLPIKRIFQSLHKVLTDLQCPYRTSIASSLARAHSRSHVPFLTWCFHRPSQRVRDISVPSPLETKIRERRQYPFLVMLLLFFDVDWLEEWMRRRLLQGLLEEKCYGTKRTSFRSVLVLSVTSCLRWRNDLSCSLRRIWVGPGGTHWLTLDCRATGVHAAVPAQRAFRRSYRRTSPTSALVDLWETGVLLTQRFWAGTARQSSRKCSI